MSSVAQSPVLQSVDALRRIIRLLRLAATRTHAQSGLSAAQLFVLHALADGRPASLTELGERTLTDRSSVAAVVARLSERGLVRRGTSGEDRRRAAVAITTTGHAVLRRSPEPPTVLLISAIRALSAERRAALASGLSALEGALGVAGEPAGMLFDDNAIAKPPGRTRGPTRRKSRTSHD